jgi:DNA-binding transcriptional MerR regulator
MSALSIGQLAKRAGVGIDTARYYERNVAKVRRAAEGKLADIEQRLAELKRIGNGLRALIAACPILNALQQELR